MSLSPDLLLAALTETQRPYVIDHLAKLAGL